MGVALLLMVCASPALGQVLHTPNERAVIEQAQADAPADKINCSFQLRGRLSQENPDTVGTQSYVFGEDHPDGLVTVPTWSRQLRGTVSAADPGAMACSYVDRDAGTAEDTFAGDQTGSFAHGGTFNVLLNQANNYTVRLGTSGLNPAPCGSDWWTYFDGVIPTPEEPLGLVQNGISELGLTSWEAWDENPEDRAPYSSNYWSPPWFKRSLVAQVTHGVRSSPAGEIDCHETTITGHFMYVRRSVGPQWG